MAKKANKSFNVEVRKNSTVVGETGTADRIEETYVLGATIDGQFVPFVTKNAGYIEHLVTASKDRGDTTSTDDEADDEAA